MIIRKIGADKKNVNCIKDSHKKLNKKDFKFFSRLNKLANQIRNQ